MPSLREAFALSAAQVDELTPPGTVRIVGLLLIPHPFQY
jgi:hypothetical protein